MERAYPGSQWQREAPSALGIDETRLVHAREWMDRIDPPGGYRVLIVRAGRANPEFLRLVIDSIVE